MQSDFWAGLLEVQRQQHLVSAIATLQFAKERLSHLFADLDHPGCTGLPR